MARQKRVLGRESPPRLVLLADAAALYRQVGTPETMAVQLHHLAGMSEQPNVTLQVMPEVVHASVASEYLIADDAVWAEHVITGGVYVTPGTLSAVLARFDSLRAECMKSSESLTLIKSLEQAWRTGGRVPTRQAAAGHA